MRDDSEANGDIDAWVHRKLNAGERLMGFGHRVFRHGDPRAEELRKALQRLGPGAGRLAHAMEQKKTGRLICPASTYIGPIPA